MVKKSFSSLSHILLHVQILCISIKYKIFVETLKSSQKACAESVDYFVILVRIKANCENIFK